MDSLVFPASATYLAYVGDRATYAATSQFKRGLASEVLRELTAGLFFSLRDFSLVEWK